MEFDELPAVWQRNASGPVPESVLAEVAEKARHLERMVRRRDWIESGVSLLMVPVFAVSFLQSPHLVSRIGAALLVAVCLFIPLRLRSARRGFEARPEADLATFLRRERDRVLAQARLLGSVLWWYLLPLGVGVVLLFGGGVRSWPLSIAYAVIVTLLYAWIYRLNRHAVTAELDPRLTQLDALLRSMEDGSAP